MFYFGFIDLFHDNFGGKVNTVQLFTFFFPCMRLQKFPVMKLDIVEGGLLNFLLKNIVELDCRPNSS